jgi:hypothetical protein
MEIPLHGVTSVQQEADIDANQIARSNLLQANPVVSQCRIMITVGGGVASVDDTVSAMVEYVVLVAPPTAKDSSFASNTGTSTVMFLNATELNSVKNDIAASNIQYVTAGDSSLTTFCLNHDAIIMTDVMTQATEKKKTVGLYDANASSKPSVSPSPS